MRILSNPHTHTNHSDGKATPEEMIQRAIALGFRSIGFSDHSVQEFDTFFTIDAEDEDAYIAHLRALGEQYRGDIRVHVGVELDAFAGIADPSKYDYLLLAAHYAEKDGERAFVDATMHKEKLFLMRSEQFGGDGAALAARYFETLAEAAARMRPAIVGHLDLVKVFNRDGALYDDRAPELMRVKHDALLKIHASGALLEINTGGMARGRVDEPYPSTSLWQAWREMGGRVILGSDSHHPDTLNYGFDAMRDLLLQHGFETVWELGGAGEPLFVERALR